MTEDPSECAQPTTRDTSAPMSNAGTGAHDLNELLFQRSSANPGQIGYTFLENGNEQKSSYQEIHARAASIAHSLLHVTKPGSRALLLYPPGLEYVAAFFGCLQAGVIAVPAYPPNPLQLERSLSRLRGIARDADPAVVLTTGAVRDLAGGLLTDAPELTAPRWLATDDTEAHEEERPEVHVSPDTVAVLQYTSGSTGAPRGVMLSHANLLHNSSVIHRNFGHSEQSRGVIWLPPYHDMGLIGGILQPLYGGFPVTLMPPNAFLRDPFSWLREISRTGATTSGGPNFAYDLCVRKTTPEQRGALDLGKWRVAFNGAEPIRSRSLERFAEAFAPSGFRPDAFHPCYGLAEATLMVTGGFRPAPAVDRVDGEALSRGWAVPAADGAEGTELVGCGSPPDDLRLVVADPDSLTRCPPGRVGEIWVSGPSVAQGYWNRDDTSEHVFGARLADTGEGPFLRTGDLGYLRGDQLVVTGRRSDMIVVRGRNHYPHDIERTVEAAHPSVRPGCGAAFGAPGAEGERLVIVQELRDTGDAAPATEAIRRAVAREHGLHTHTVVVLEPGSIPKTSSGKIQRTLCRRRFLDGTLAEPPQRPPLPVGDAAPVPPSDALGFLRDLLQRTLDVPDVDASAAPLELGADSLTVLTVQQEVLSAFGVELPLHVLLEADSLTGVAAWITDRLDGSGGAEGTAADGSARAPLSQGQRSLWFLQQLEPDSDAHIISTALRLRGRLDVDALSRAFDALARRHEALRTAFDLQDGEPVRVVRPDATVPVERHDARGLDERRLLDRAGTWAHAPFDLRTAPLLRVGVFERADDEVVVVLAVHHIVTDFWSMTVLARELSRLYAHETEGTPADLPAPRATFADVLSRQRERLSGASGERLRAYWEGQLAGSPPPVRPPSMTPAPRPGTGPGATLHLRLDGELTERLAVRARSEGVTLYMLLTAAFHTLLHRHTGQEDLLVGTPTAGRGGPELADVVGYCTNPVVLRTRMAGATSFSELLAQVRGQVAGALDHQDYPTHLISRARGDEQDALFHTMFVYNRPPRSDEGRAALLFMNAGSSSFCGLRADPLVLPDHDAALDLELTMAEVDGALTGALRHRTDVVDHGTARAMADQFTVLLEELAGGSDLPPGELRMTSEDEYRRVVFEHNGTARPREFTPVPELIARRSALTPDATAVWTPSGALTHAELGERANRLAHLLRSRGAAPGTRVGLHLGRSPDLVAALLAVMRTGASYVPTDPLTPPERLRAVFTDASVALVVTDGSHAQDLPEGAGPEVLVLDELRPELEGLPVEAPNADIRPETPVYVVYTSGTTGTPKGVEVTHGALANHTLFAVDRFGLVPQDRVLQFASIGFDASAEEIYPTLTAGAALVLRDDTMVASPARFMERCRDWGVSVLDLPTGYWRELVPALGAESAVPPSLRLVVLGGERVTAHHVRLWTAHVGDRVRLVNTYGPTEATVIATSHELTGASPTTEVPIGLPIDNVHVHVLDPRGRPSPVGAVGELYIGGAGLATGYLNLPGPTAERFPANHLPLPGDRLYRTGDLARRLPDGTLLFVGRADRQVKLHGYRIEPAEVEAVLLEHPGVTGAAVVAHEDRNLLAAYVTGTGDAAALREHLRASLPEYMVPAVLLPVDTIPTTASGKVDASALPDPVAHQGAAAASRDLTPPRSHGERVVAEAVAEVLGLDAVGVHEDFFALGGHSLLAAKLVAGVNARLGADLPLRAVFDQRTAARIAALAETGTASPGVRLPPILPVPRDGSPFPLAFTQERIWFIQRLDPLNTAYNVPRALRVHGEVDLGVLEWVFAELERRHEILRTSFPEVDGVPVQVVGPCRGLPVTVVDLEGSPEATDPERLREWILDAGRRPFDLSRDQLLRLNLLRLSPREHILVVIEHHLIHDGWAQGVFLRDFLELYEARAAGRPDRLPELPVQYADFAAWQRDNLRGGVLEELTDFWRRELEGAPRALALPTDRPRPESPTFDGDQEVLEIDADLADAVRGLGEGRGQTLFMTMFAAFSVLMYRHSGQEDLVLGAGIANRLRPETENLLGMIINTVLLRVDLSGEPDFLEVMERVGETCLRAYEHQDMPFEKLVEALRPARDPGRNPLFQVMFSFLDTPMPALDVPGLSFEVIDAHNRTAKFDLNIVVVAHAEQRRGRARAAARGGITVLMEYDTDLYDAATVRLMLDRFEELLRAVTATPGLAAADLLPELGKPAPPPADENERDDDWDDDWGDPTPYVAPRTRTEETLALIWQEVMEIPEVGVEHDFFELGGHSLLATRIVARIAKEFAVEVPLRSLFEAPTIAEMAVVVLDLQVEQTSEGDLDALLSQIEK